MARRTIPVLAALTLAALLAFPPPQATNSTGTADEPRTTAQDRARAEMGRLTGRVATAWLGRRAATGLFRDPITGAAGHGYGPAMLAEVLMREGHRRHDRRMVDAGLRALARNASAAAGDGDPGNPLELLGTASAYLWGERNLAGTAAWSRWSAAPRAYLRGWEGADVGVSAQRCFAAPTCWNNYKIVDAAAVLLLLQTELSSASPEARADLRVRAMAVLREGVPRALGGSAQVEGRGVRLSGLGLLADQPTYPLAYHAMSVAALARALEALGSRAPAGATDAFRRAMLAQAAFMAPDGDVAFLGRAQGESWALGATAYAGQYCAATFARSFPRSAGMCATLANRAVGRLARLHGFRKGVMAIVPRFATTPLTDAGLERYARVMTFNGLTGVFLSWAQGAARRAADVQPAPLPLDAGGAFVDPAQARLAVVRRGPVWLAVHGIGPKGVDDLRYDFGVVALKFRRPGGWVDVMPQRPLVEDTGALDGGGPALWTAAGLAFPHGRRITADARTGEVRVRGGYRTAPGVPAAAAEFRFRPSQRGVTLTASAPPGATLRVQDFLPAAWTRADDDLRVLRTPTAVSRLSEPPVSLLPGVTLPSANSTQLQGFQREVVVPADGRIRWSLAARPRSGG
jgi:hypothetical protein